MIRQKKLLSVTKNHLFRRAYSKGKSYATHSVVVYVIKGGSRRETRTGITVSTKHGNAVVRVRTRRIIREALRALVARTMPGYVVIVVARQGAIGKKSTDILRELTVSFEKAGILAPQVSGSEI